MVEVGATTNGTPWWWASTASGGHIVAAGGGERDAGGAGRPEQRCAPDRQPADRGDQGRHVPADHDGLFGRQPCLIQQGDRRSVRRIEPAQRGRVHHQSVRDDGGEA